jgi:hypothetical protein
MHARPIPCCSGFGFLHVMSVPVVMTSTSVPPVPPVPMSIPVPAAVSVPVPVPVPAMVITHPAHPVSIMVLSRTAGEGQTPDSENQQQTKNYDSLSFHVAPFQNFQRGLVSRASKRKKPPEFTPLC